jgi:CDGSH-type Zn-finger protein/mannose-6-phosphate isomerase-like protein (cupin superfamily)
MSGISMDSESTAIPNDQAVVAAKKPLLIQVDAQKYYYWCACGRSKKQPFCDGSHKGTSFQPLVWQAPKDEKVLFCTCKQSKNPPFCDGSHNQLDAKYGKSDDPQSVVSDADVELVEFAVLNEHYLRAALDNGCYVIRPRVPDDTKQSITREATIAKSLGSVHLDQYEIRLNEGQSPVWQVDGSDVVLFVMAGFGEVVIAGRATPIEPHCGVFIKAGESFQIVQHEALLINATVCPSDANWQELTTHHSHFDTSISPRVQGVDPEQQQAMADRFFQVLVDDSTQGSETTLFIGHVPQSRAAHHRHLYEETISVLSGQGFMWTDRTKAEIRPGDTIYLPAQQSHSVECCNADGLFLVGAFYPSMSPAINY